MKWGGAAPPTGERGVKLAFISKTIVQLPKRVRLTPTILQDTSKLSKDDTSKFERRWLYLDFNRKFLLNTFIVLCDVWKRDGRQASLCAVERSVVVILYWRAPIIIWIKAIVICNSRLFNKLSQLFHYQFHTPQAASSQKTDYHRAFGFDRVLFLVNFRMYCL